MDDGDAAWEPGSVVGRAAQRAHRLWMDAGRPAAGYGGRARPGYRAQTTKVNTLVSWPRSRTNSAERVVLPDAFLPR